MPLGNFQCLYLGNKIELRMTVAKLPGLKV